MQRHEVHPANANLDQSAGALQLRRGALGVVAYAGDSAAARAALPRIGASRLLHLVCQGNRLNIYDDAWCTQTLNNAVGIGHGVGLVTALPSTATTCRTSSTRSCERPWLRPLCQRSGVRMRPTTSLSRCLLPCRSRLPSCPRSGR